MEDEQRERTARRSRRLKKHRSTQDVFDRRYEAGDNIEPDSGRRSRRRPASTIDELDSDYETKFPEG